MNAKLPTPSLTWDWHFAAFGVRPRFTISWAFACGLIAAGALQPEQRASVVLLLAAWLVADPLFGAITTHLLTLRELRIKVRSAPGEADELVTLSLDTDQPQSQRVAGFFRNLIHDLRTYPGLTGHSLSALATAIACLIMSIFINNYATVITGAGLLLLAWVAIITGDKPIALADCSSGVQTAVAFLLAVAVIKTLTWNLMILAVLLGMGAAFRPAWLRMQSAWLQAAVTSVWMGIAAYLVYARQPVPASLVACAGLADHLCLRDNPERAEGFIITQLPWQVSLLLISLAASQWV